MEHVAVIVCTYRRPLGLVRLLKSMERLEEARLPFRVVVVDNNPIGEEVSLEGVALDVDVVRETRAGIPWARNAGLLGALQSPDCRYVVFVDDDQVVCPGWLRTLLEVHEQTGAEVVAGPVLPLFEQPPPSWVVDEGLFNRERHPTGTELSVAYTGNVLIEAAVLRSTGLRFEAKFQRGEDSYFFRSLAQQGYRIVWADEAESHEWNPPSRFSLRWIIGREFVQGYVRTREELHFNPGPFTRILLLVAALSRLVRGSALLLLSPFGPKARQVRGLCRLGAGTGRLWATLGLPYSLSYELSNALSKS